MLVMLEEGVHENLQCGQIPGSLHLHAFFGQTQTFNLTGYQGVRPRGLDELVD
jgi:hypothetical protein